MADQKHLTIVIKGPVGSARTQVGEIIKHHLLAQGFSDVSYIDTGCDIYEGDGSVKDMPIQITETVTG